MGHKPVSILELDRCGIVEVFKAVGRNPRENLRGVDLQLKLEIAHNPILARDSVIDIIDDDRNVFVMALAATLAVAVFGLSQGIIMSAHV